ncbi:hypothetical protein [Bradyrhizobium sp. AZCC 1678]|uniref:hypothetical protein n=1 Tax=Bradyrhizobium sp. AZCC 1678 TaxID=3117030 RepID=UPI003FA5E6AC
MTVIAANGQIRMKREQERQAQRDHEVFVTPVAARRVEECDFRQQPGENAAHGQQAETAKRELLTLDAAGEGKEIPGKNGMHVAIATSRRATAGYQNS